MFLFTLVLFGVSLVLASAETNSTNPFPVLPCHGIDMKDVTVSTLQSHLASGRLTSVQLCQCYIDRISLTNPYLRHVIEVNPDWAPIANDLDIERSRGKVRGPLHGIPILTKDNIATLDKQNTTDGNLALLGSRVKDDAFVVKKLRAAGAVLLGHANESEDADHRAVIDFAEGWSDRGGQCRNVWNGTQSTAGSSTGSAQAVAGHNIPLSVGTETHGSVLHPAGHAGVVGLKPTVGLTSRDGVIPGSHNRDSVGTFARNVKDAAVLLDAMYGVDENDAWSIAQIGKTPDGGYAQFATNSSGLKGAVFGIPYPIWWSTVMAVRAPGNQAKFLRRLRQLEEAGATIVNMTEPLPYAYEIQNAYGWGDAVDTPYWLQSARYLSVDMYTGYTEWLREKITWPNGTDGGLPMENLGDMVVWNQQNNDTTGALGGSYPWKSGQDALIAAVATAGKMDARYWKALHWRQSRSQACINGAHAYRLPNGTAIQLDAVLIPNAGGGLSSSSIASVPDAAQYPGITIPIDVDGFNVPIGLGIWGQAYGEGNLVKWASAMENLFKFNAEFEPKFVNYDSTKIPFDARWDILAARNRSTVWNA
ncbi:putative amidase [Pseudocercospora fuligena]|uniref:Putative amidase n=1 Tax=Pseudocercospora fuligena TaxID=685502 RepID=A0A8H6VJ92_9PEZI|nr:putative amidase [Pseudocercospora fuligena]